MTSTVATPRFIVGTEAYFATQGNRVPHDFSEYDEVSREFMPINVRPVNKRDGYYQELQQKMMDFGWRLNEDEDGSVFFTHPTYDNSPQQTNRYAVYCHYLSNGKEIMLPLVDRADDPKGLGCTVVQTAGPYHYEVETNEWHSYWDNRKGRRRARYLNYLDARQKKREEYKEMAKTDSSIKVWEKDTPRCDPLTWHHNNPSPSQYAELA